MAFTYDITTTTGRIRRLIGDTVEDAGPLPEEPSNFNDDEIAFFYESEGSHIQRGAAAGLEALSSAWAAHEGRYRSGPEDEESSASAAYAANAAQLRMVYGWNKAADDAASAQAGGFSVGVRRTDA